MKKQTFQKHTKIANDIMYYIYKYIDTDINLDQLAFDLEISKFHMHRIFKAEFDINIYESIKSIRLQKASTLLLTNKHSTITDIAKACGYSSQASFIRVFKEKFHTTPNQWRKSGYHKFIDEILQMSSHIKAPYKNFSHLEPEIVKVDSFEIYYIRHKGYNKSIKKTWQKLQTWILSNNIQIYQQIGLHHDNPILTPLSECKYIAAIATKDTIQNPSLPKLSMQEGVYAKFDFSGEYGDILYFLQWIYSTWLLENAYETTTNPSFAIYEKNHFIQKDGDFIVSYYIPISL